MSEEPQSSDSAPEAPKKARRAAASPRPRKTAKKAAQKSAEPVEAAAPVPAAPAQEAPAPAARPEAVKRQREERPAIFESGPVARDPRLDDISGHESHDQGSKSGWPEPETIQGGSEGSAGSGKRKRRRKKKGGQGSQGGQQPFHGGQAPQEHSSPRTQQPAPQATEAAHPRPQPAPQQPQAPRIPVDAEELSKKAWRIFLGEVGEEGLALIGDQDAREISRRSFRLAEIFLEEQGRRGR